MKNPFREKPSISCSTLLYLEANRGVAKWGVVGSKKIGRREMLTALATGALGAGALAAANPLTVHAEETEGDRDEKFLGTWDVAFTNDATGLTRQAMVVFTSGGGLLNVQPDYPTAGLGAWSSDNESTCSFKILQWDYRDGLPPARVVMQGKARVKDWTMVGAYASEITRSGVVILRGSFTFRGSRLDPR